MVNRRSLVEAVAIVALTLIVLATLGSLVALAANGSAASLVMMPQIVAAGAAAIAAIVAYLVRKDVKAAAADIQVVHLNTNGLMLKLLQQTEARATAEAILIERAAVVAAQKAAELLHEQRTRPPEE